MNTDYIFYHAKHAPKATFWEKLRGVKTRREAMQEELLEKSTKADHLKFLTEEGETASIRKRAADKRIATGMKTGEVETGALCAPDATTRERLIDRLGPSEKPNPTTLGHIILASKHKDDALRAAKLLIDCTAPAPANASEKEQNEAKIRTKLAFSVLETVVLSVGNDAVGMMIFEKLKKEDKIKPSYAEKLRDGAVSPKVKKAAKELLR